MNEPATPPPGVSGPPRVIALSFAVSALASVGMAVVYARGGQPQLEGLLLFPALGGIALGLIEWANRLLPQGPYTEARPPLPSGVSAREAAAQALEAGAEVLERRRFLFRLLGTALAALAAALVFPVRSLGRAPGRSLFRTDWHKGSAVVTASGDRVRPGDLATDGVLTVFPTGAERSADSQALLIRLPAGAYRRPPGREDWAPDDVVAFSKVCTHAGCPVGLYEPVSHQLLCPCHQSVFAVLDNAQPIDGPATRRLPQLPLAIDGEGYLVARGDFAEPVGPGFWSRDRRA